MAKIKSVGGQAVIEGVMMRGAKGIATAVRKTNGEIVIDMQNSIPYVKRNKLLALPFIRGFVTLLESLIMGINALNFSSSFFMEEEEQTKVDKFLDGVLKERKNSFLMGVSLFISMAFAIMLFFVLPTAMANSFKKLNFESSIALNIFEGIIRVAIFLIYLVLISYMKDIQRVFQYHGAEHKSIFCYENDIDLTVENAASFGRLHPRCGTNFMFLVMIVSIIVFSFTGWNSLSSRIISRVVLLPVISGVTYEIIRWLGKSENTLARILSWPGLMLQKITTKEPDMEQLEVAIAALKAAEGIE